MEKIRPYTLSGFMELLPEKQCRMDLMIETLRRVYGLYGFTGLDTPLVESAEILLAKGGGETEKQIYRFRKGDSDLALRFDLTVPLAKYVALHYSELSFPFRRFQIGKVYRGERAQKGRFREFIQADIDIIGDGELSICNEAEIPSIIYRAFMELGLRRFVIRVNNRKLLTGFYELLGLGGRAGEIMRAVDKLEKAGHEKVLAILTDDLGLGGDEAGEILRFTTLSGSNATMLAALETYEGRSGVFDEGLRELREVTRLLGAFGVPEDHFGIDLSIARGLDYYTGTVYETTMTDHPEVGSICSGGRYDDLAGYYTEKRLPGVGISIGLTRLFSVLDDCGLLSKSVETAPADALIIPMTADLGPAVELATALRSRGVRTELYTEEKKFKAKITYASRLGIPFALFLGEDEIEGGFVSIKDLGKGEQVKVPIAAAPEYLSGKIASRPVNTVISE